MSDATRHINITEENLKGALDELKNKRFTNVGLTKGAGADDIGMCL
ncbi:MAG: hypothetical protein ACUVQY_07485 [Thermoproteota archaeon]